MMRAVFITLFCISFAFSHGLFYSAKEGKAIIINAHFTKSNPAAYAKIVIYEGESAIPLITSKMDANGNFAFLPPKNGEYKVLVTATSDHGSHNLEFKLDTDVDLDLKEYEEPIFQKYSGILSAIGIIFGIFGIIAILKARKVE